MRKVISKRIAFIRPPVLLIIFLLIALNINFVSAVSPSEIVWYKGENAFDSSSSQLRNLTLQNGATTATGKIGNGLRFVRGSNQYANTSNTTTILGNGKQDFTYTYWFNLTSDCGAGNNCISNFIGTNNANAFLTHGLISAPPSWMRMSAGAGNNDSMGINWSLSVGRNNFLVLYYNSSNDNIDLYLGNSTGNLTYYPAINKASGGVTFSNNNQQIILGTDFSKTNGGDIIFDDLRIFNASLTRAEINAIWNGGNGTTSSLANLTLVATPSVSIVSPLNNSVQFYTKSWIDVNVSASNFGGTVLTNVFLFNSSLSLISNISGNSTPFYANFTSLGVGVYYLNASGTNGSVSNSTNLLTLYIYNFTSGNIISPANGTNTSSRFLNINWSNASFNPSGTPQTISYQNLSLLNDDLSFNRSIYNSAVINNNFSNYDLYSQNLSVGRYWIRLQQTDANGNTVTTQNRINITTNTVLNISARDNLGNLIQNFTINTYNSQYNFNNTITTNNYLASVDQIRTNITLNINAEGYAIANFSTANIVVNSPTYNYQFTLFQTNTINFTFYNQSGNTKMTQNVTFDLIGSISSYTNISVNGNILLPLITPDNYLMRYTSNGFTTRFYTLTVSNRSYQNIDLYLLANPLAYNWTVYVVNQVLNPVEGAVVKNLKYNLATNSYILQEIGITDIAGKTIFSVTYNDEYYKQIVEYPLGTLRKTTTPDYIDSASITIPIDLSNTNAIEGLNNYDGIGSILVFNNATNNLRLDWSDTSLVASQYCLKVYRMTGLSQTLYNDSCNVGASAGTILLGVANGSGFLYYGLATYYEDGVQKYLDSLYYQYPTPASDVPLGNKYGLFIQLILTIGMTSLVILNIGLAMILAPFSLILGKILGWNSFSWVGLLAIQVVGIILAILSSMRK